MRMIHSQILYRIKNSLMNLLTQEKRHVFRNKKRSVKHQDGSYLPIIKKTEKEEGPQKIDYHLLDVIGKGSFGIVYSATNSDGDRLAVKVKKNLKDKNLERLTNMFFEEEFMSLYKLNHPNILRVIGVEKYQYDYVSIVMEHIHGVNLNILIQKHKQMAENMIRIYAAQTLDGIAYLHHKNIIHRDIKSSNIMIVNQNYVKIIDFGMSKRVNSSYTPQIDENIAGTLAYMAPEMVNSGKYDARIDIWGLGVLVFEMAFGFSYLRDEKNIKITLVQNQEPIYFKNLSRLANNFIQSCLIKNYKQRPVGEQLKWHPFISRINAYR